VFPLPADKVTFVDEAPVASAPKRMTELSAILRAKVVLTSFDWEEMVTGLVPP
jgi:hypothetical protein